MFSKFKNLLKKNNVSFKIIEPDVELTASLPECIKRLNSAGVQYDKVCNGYIVFPAKLFNGIDLMVGVHYCGVLVEYIEIFRALGYYDSPDFKINDSFNELHDAIVSCYGKPQVATLGILNKYPSEKWINRNFVLEHYIYDRFGPEEHIHFKFLHS